MHIGLHKVITMPDSLGKRVAFKHYNWNKLQPYEEVTYANQIVELAKLVNDELAKFELVGE